METLVVLLNPRRVKRLKEMAEIFSSNEEVVLDAMGLGKGANGDEEQ